MKTQTLTYKVGSMFAGVGGICLGFKNASYQDLKYSIVWANEIDKYACETYRENFSHTLFEGDINKILDPDLCEVNERQKYVLMHNDILSYDIDVLTAGFPCQAFSIAGEHKGFEDERGNLFLSIIKLINLMQKKPRVLFLENVRNLIAHDKGNTYRVIKTEIEKLGYFVKEKVLNTMVYSSLPQNRERIYILCFKNKEDFDLFDFDKIEKENKKQFTKNERIEQIKQIVDFDNKVDDKYYYTEQKYPHYFKNSKENNFNLGDHIKEPYQFYQLRRGMYVRKNKSNVCPTLTANMGTGGHNVPLIIDSFDIRKLTPKETFLLQGFPVDKGYVLPKKFNNKSYPDSMLYKQAGNAVSVPVIELLAKEILKVFKINS